MVLPCLYLDSSAFSLARARDLARILCHTEVPDASTAVIENKKECSEIRSIEDKQAYTLGVSDPLR